MRLFNPSNRVFIFAICSILLFSSAGKFVDIDLGNKQTDLTDTNFGNISKNTSPELENKVLNTLSGFSGGFMKSLAGDKGVYELKSLTTQVVFSSSGISLSLSGSLPSDNENYNNEDSTLSAPVFLEFIESNKVVPALKEPSNTYVNVFKGTESSQWVIKEPFYKKLVYKNIYDNIDLIYQINDDGQLKYEFWVYPGGDYKNIQLRYTGLTSIIQSEEGMRLNFKTQMKENSILDSNPINFLGSEKQIEVKGSFEKISNLSYGYSIADYDTSKLLIIDPMLEFSTYLGGSSDDSQTNIVLDASGNIYLAGRTQSINFPMVNSYNSTHGGGGTSDIFVAKLSNDGSTLLYSTFIGGSDLDHGRGIALDNAGNIYVIGDTWSLNFPTTNGAYNRSHNGGTYDITVSKLSNDGASLLYSTYLGGNATDSSQGIVVDSSGNAYITGNTGSANFPTTLGAYNQTFGGGNDIFITKLSADGSSLVFSTYFGGSGSEAGNDIMLDADNNIILRGYTTSTGLTTPGAYDTSLNGGYDALISKFSNDGSTLINSTIIGGSLDDWATAFFLDNTSGNLYITGYTHSSNFPVSLNANDTTYNGGLNDIYVLELDANWSAIHYSTYIGGSGDDQSRGIYVDQDGNAYITGFSDNADYPTTIGALNETFNGLKDVILAKLNYDGSEVLYSTFFGGVNFDVGTAFAMDDAGNIYVAGQTQDGFPTTSGAFNETFSGVYDLIICKFSLEFTAPDVSAVQGEYFKTVQANTDIQWTAGDQYPAFYYVTRNGEFIPSTKGWSNGTISYTVSGIPAGNYSFNLVVVDQSGNIANASIKVIVDGTPPDISGVSPVIVEYGTVLNEISWTLGDQYPSFYNITKNGTIFGTVATPWRYNRTTTLSLDGYPLGNYNFTMNLFDLAGNNSTLTIVVYVVDTTPPTIDTPSNVVYSYITSNNGITWTVDDYFPSMYNITRNDVNIVLNAPWSNGQIPFNPGILSPGPYNYTIYVYDTSGNVVTDSVIVFVDGTPPDVNAPTDVFIEYGTSGNEISWIIGDKYPNLYNITDDNGVVVSDTFWSNSTITLNVDGNGLGTYNFTISVYDVAGNNATVTIKVHVVDKTSPDLDMPIDYSYAYGSTGNTIIWTVGDTFPGIYNLTLDSVNVTINKGWNNGTITVNSDNLSPGTHNYTLYLFDSSGNVITDDVQITVLSIPLVSSPQDIVLTSGSLGYAINWSVSDNNPDYYNITRNGEIIVSKASWSNGYISYNLDNLLEGVYNFTLYLVDLDGNINTDWLFVFVDDTAPTVTGPIFHTIEYGTNGTYISWELADNHPFTYNITRNGVVIVSDTPWKNGTIHLEVFDYDIGYYFYNLVAYDAVGNYDNCAIILQIVDTTKPTISNPANISYEEGSTGNAIEWQVDDLDPANYTVTRNEITILSAKPWLNGTILINIDNLEVGDYLFVIDVFDKSGNVISNKVNVIVVDTTPPTISSPDDLTYQEGETGNDIVWQAFDTHPGVYNITINNIIVNETRIWNNNTIVLNIDNLSQGIYTIQINLYDIFGNSASDTVIVTVTQPTDSIQKGSIQISIPSIFVALLISVGVIRIRVSKNAVYYKKRKFD